AASAVEVLHVEARVIALLHVAGVEDALLRVGIDRRPQVEAVVAAGDFGDAAGAVIAHAANAHGAAHAVGGEDDVLAIRGEGGHQLQGGAISMLALTAAAGGADRADLRAQRHGV